MSRKEENRLNSVITEPESGKRISGEGCPAVRKKAGRKTDRKRAERLYRACDKLLDKLIEGIENTDAIDLVSDKNGIKAIAACLEDIKGVLDVHSERDLAEQDARIARLRQAVEAGGDDGGAGKLVVVMDGETEEYAG